MKAPLFSRMPRTAALGWGLAAGLAALALQAQPQTASSKWETEIRAFEAADKTNPPPHDAILFVGSSTIRLWKTLAQDFHEFKVVNRGFGGSQIVDSVALAERIIVPCRPRMVVLYAGDNDIAAGKPPEEVFADFKAFVAKVQSALPKARIAFISIKPSPSRWHLVNKIKTANKMIDAFCRQDERLIFVDVFTPMLGTDGQPRPELFLEDRLHMNAAGYALWTELIKPRLKE